MSDSPLYWFQAAGGGAVLALGAFVLSVRPRTRASLAFGVFAVAFGGYFLVGNASYALHTDGDVRDVAQTVLILVTMVGLAAMALLFPRPLTAAEWKPAAGAAVVASVLLVVHIGAMLHKLPTTPVRGAHVAAGMASMQVMIGYAALLAARFHTASDDGSRRQLALTAGGLTLWLGWRVGHGEFVDGSGSVLYTTGWDLLAGALLVLTLVGVAIIWLSATGGPQGRLARNVAWLTLACILVGLVVSVSKTAVPGAGVTRLAMTGVLAYAVLKHQLLGLDVKVRWTISKSTVAAAFVAAFFLASEGAQILFGQGNEWVGLLAAGALVFALAPLQRAAERLAEKAVPVAAAGGPGAAGAGSRAEDAYRGVLRRYLRGGALTRDEERALAVLAGELRLDAGRAFELREQVEREMPAAQEAA